MQCQVCYEKSMAVSARRAGNYSPQPGPQPRAWCRLSVDVDPALVSEAHTMALAHGMALPHLVADALELYLHSVREQERTA